MKENVYFGDVYKAFTKDIMHAVLWKFLQTPKNVIATAQHLSAVIIPGYLPNTPLFFFFFGCVGSSLLRVGFFYLRQVWATLRCGAQASCCGGFSCCGARALGVRASVVAACGLSSCSTWALEHRLSSCGAWA